MALDLIVSGQKTGALAYNLGNGQGFSVQEVIDVVQKVVSEDGCSLVVEDGERRLGDPAILVADATQAKKVLNWQPKYADLETIIRHVWFWERRCLNI